MRPVIDIRNVHRIFESEAVCAHILHNVSLTVNPGEFVAITGPSGSGKSTLMNILGCLDKPTAGDYYLQGLNVAELDDDELTEVRALSIGFVFQSFNLLPRLSVIENVMLPMSYTNVPRSQREMRAVHALQAVTLPVDHWDHCISELSGGQMQRVAIARALVSRPKVLLLDEPLAALDLKLRKDMQQELKKIQKATGITFVFVTHDQEEALSMSDTVVVMSEGRIQQIGTPIDIYNEPTNAFVADFIGESNIVDGIMLEDRKVSFSGHTFDCVDAGFGRREPVDVVVRPEDVDVVPEEKGMLRGVVTSVTFLGVHYEIIVDIGGFKWMIQTTDFVDVDEHIGLYIEPDAIHIMHKSEYSGMYGDYSSFSNELDELSNAESESEE